MNKTPLPRGTCMDCTADFPMHKAIRQIASPLFTEGETAEAIISSVHKAKLSVIKNKLMD
jgi:hypothetical protein